jgi:hypothetical protein
VIIAVLTNEGNGWPESIEKKIARAVLGLPEPRVADLPLDPESAALYVGTWDTGNFPLVVSADSGRLHVAIKGPVPLSRQADHVFVSRSDPDAVRLTFEVAEDTQPRLILEFAGMRWYAIRTAAAGAVR